MYRYRALTPGGLQRGSHGDGQSPSPSNRLVPVTARVHGGCRVWLKGKKIHLRSRAFLCKDAQTHTFTLPFPHFSNYALFMRHVFHQQQLQIMIMSERAVVGSVYHGVSTTVIELRKTQFLWFATRNGHGQKLNALVDHALIIYNNNVK